MQTSDQYAAEAARWISAVTNNNPPDPVAQAAIGVAQVHAHLAVVAAIRETAADVIATLQGRS